ncbi:MAG: ribosomal-protein-alanine N-acetyltransferase [Streptosporangiales bacterium]|nr:ribosomal-protein-alanine N-acetyltransferase [Streptosporangiales bacterium]
MRWWHIEQAAALEERLFVADAWPVEAFWSELAQADSRHYLVVEDAGEVRGYAGLLAVDGGPDADVLTLAVHPDEQGHGWGTRLLRSLLDEAHRRRCANVLLEVRGDNAPALALYERHGFERISVRRGYYADGDDAIVMRRRAGAN